MTLQTEQQLKSVDNRSKCNGPDIKTEHTLRNKMTNDRSKIKSINKIYLNISRQKNQCIKQLKQTTQNLTRHMATKANKQTDKHMTKKNPEQTKQSKTNKHPPPLPNPPSPPPQKKKPKTKNENKNKNKTTIIGTNETPTSSPRKRTNKQTNKQQQQQQQQQKQTNKQTNKRQNR